MYDKESILEKITEEDVLEIMKNFNAFPFGEFKENEIWFSTVCHGGGSHKLCYFRDSKTFNCYTNCGKMSLFDFVAKVANCKTFGESLGFVANAIGLNSRVGFNSKPIYNSNKRELSEINKYIAMRNKTRTSLTHLPPFDTGKLLDYFESDVFYNGWVNEGISISTMEFFKIKWYELEKHIIIMHLNMLGEIVGVRRRSLQERDKANKYMPVIVEGVVYKHSLNKNFYGLYEHLKGIKKFKKVVIVESEKSVLLAHEYYGEDAFVIATCGFNVSNWHRNILLTLGVKEVILGFDKDFEVLDFEDSGDDESDDSARFDHYVKRLYSIAYKFAPFFTTYVLWDRFGKLDKKDSPFDKGKETLEFLMKNKVEITTNRED